MRPLLFLLTACGVPATPVEVPHLELPATVDIVDAPLGVRATTSVQIRNRGTAAARVELAYDADLTGPSSLRLEPGTTVTVRLSTTPMAMGTQELLATLSTERETVELFVRVEPIADGDRDGVDSVLAGGLDCDDGNPNVAPGLPEYCNRRDDDCDGAIDEDAVDQRPWYLDADRDGWGVTDTVVRACSAPALHAALDGDCDDADPQIHPGQTELYYDGIDADCDGWSDFDADHDGFDSAGYGGGDCSDSRADVYPGAPERMDGRDQDCDTLIDEVEALVGDVAFTEVFVDPFDSESFIELRSTSADLLELSGLSVQSSTTVPLPTPLGLDADDVLVLCPEAFDACDIVLPGLVLDESGALHIGQLDTVDLAELPLGLTRSAQWPGTPDPAANDDGALWCDDQPTPGTDASCTP